MPSPNSNGVDQVATQLMDTLTAELPPDASIMALPKSKAANLVVATPEDRSVCSALLGDTKRKLAAIDEDRKRLTRPLDALKKMIMDKYQPAVTFFMGEKAIYEGKLGIWDREQERLRLEAERKQREEVERQRQAEIRAAQEEEAKRRAEAEELRKKAEAEMNADRQEQLRIEAAERLQAAQQEAADRIANAEMMSAAPLAPAVAHIGGESQSWKYSAEEVNLDRIIEAVYQKRLPKSVLMFNAVGANKLASALQDEFRAQYPEAACGIRLVKTPVYSHRQKRGSK